MRGLLVSISLIAATLCACQTTATSNAALVTATTDDGLFTVELRTLPTQPPPRAGAKLDVHVADAQGADVDGLTVEVVPWMPAMGHGASVNPTVTAQDHGHYLAEPLELAMAGTWQMRITLKKGAQESHVAPTLDVP